MDRNVLPECHGGGRANDEHLSEETVERSLDHGDQEREVAGKSSRLQRTSRPGEGVCEPREEKEETRETV
jgi:hypothetical protein